jgi:hypothetical protein
MTAAMHGVGCEYIHACKVLLYAISRVWCAHGRCGLLSLQGGCVHSPTTALPTWLQHMGDMGDPPVTHR